MSPLDTVDSSAAMAETGALSEASRRLSDKILSAFNHAYAVGEKEVAMKLMDALEANETRHRPADDKRRSYDPLGQAEMWVAFVEARNRYKGVCESRKTDPAAVAAALEGMKDAYRRWSMS